MPKTSLDSAGTETDQMFELASMPPSGAAEVYAMPATQAQERFWSLDRLSPGNPGLNMPMMWQCTGQLNLPLLNEAFSRTIERHESLRTTFAIVDGRLNQVIGIPYPVLLPVTNLEHVPNAPNSAEAFRLTSEHAAYRMDLEKGPLIVLKLLRFSETNHMLLVTMHHIICDGASLGVLLRDVAAFYESLVLHKRAVLPELPIQFADFAIWQQEWHGDSEHQASLKYWRDALGNQFTKIMLPRDSVIDSETPAGEEKRASVGDIETRLIPGDLATRAQEFCKRESITVNVLLMSVFSALLSRITGQKDLLIASPTANRTLETEDLIGLFMNIQIMRVRLEEKTPFQSLIGQVQEWTLGATANQKLPFEELVHDPYFSVGENSIELPVFFLYQRSFMVNHEIGGLKIVPLRSMSPGAVFEMMFAVVNRQHEGTRLQLEYNPLHFRSETIQRYLDFFLALLDSGLQNPAASVDELSLARTTAPAEIVNLASRAIDTVPHDAGRSIPPFKSVDQAFLRYAREIPENVAVECDGEVWSYRQLAESSAELADRLRNEGLKPEGRVAISLERSPWLLGAVLAVLRAGGTCVPIDPELPSMRVAAIIADAGAELVLADREFTVAGQAKVLRVGAGGRGAEASGKPHIPGTSPKVDTHSLAFLLYTSDGSGVPRGVAIEHAGLTTALRFAGQELNLSSGECLVAASPFDSDVAPLEMLLPLTLGMRVVVVTEEQLSDSGRLSTLIETSQTTVLSATSETLHSLLRAGWQPRRSGPSNTTHLKVLCDRATLSRSLSEKLLQRGNEVWALFGFPETSTCSALTQVEIPGIPSLGKPVDDTVFYLLDAAYRAVPVGIVGELYIGGDHLARGYWGRTELTDENFVPNPFGSGRLYRAGNLGRWQQAYGNDQQLRIELLERSDRSAKIEGHQVELGEIEVALCNVPEVLHAVVLRDLIPHITSGSPQIVGFVELGEKSSNRTGVFLEQELRTALLRTLPAYMVPKAIISMPRLPRDRAGKIDRRALAVDPASLETLAEVLRQEDEADPQTSRDPIEWQLVEIWRATLNIPAISVDDSFFSLGVSSLAALRLITKMNKMYSTDLGLASLFSASTIRAIARLIRDRVSPNMTSSVVPIQPNGKRPPLFILHGVGGNVVSFYGLAMHLGADQPVYGIQAQALLADQPALLRLKDMARYYVKEMRRVQPEGPYRLLGYSFGGTVVLEMAHQLREAGQEVALLGMLDSKARSYMQQVRSYLKDSRIKNNRRIKRARNEAASLNANESPKSLSDKVRARSIRWASMAAAVLRIRTLPSFMKDANEINSIASSNYEARPYDGRMTLFRASKQAIPTAPADLGWHTLFARGVDVHMLPGDHERIFAEQNIEILATEINECLRASSGY